MVTELESLHQEFERMRVFAISSAEGQVRRPPIGPYLYEGSVLSARHFCWTFLQEEDVGSKERIAQIEFVLKYIAQVVSYLQ